MTKTYQCKRGHEHHSDKRLTECKTRGCHEKCREVSSVGRVHTDGCKCWVCLELQYQLQSVIPAPNTNDTVEYKQWQWQIMLCRRYRIEGRLRDMWHECSVTTATESLSSCPLEGMLYLRVVNKSGKRVHHQAYKYDQRKQLWYRITIDTYRRWHKRHRPSMHSGI